MFVTRNLNRAKDVARNLYVDDSKTIGILSASGADQQKEVPLLPLDQYRYNQVPNAALYFNHKDSKY